MIYLNDTGLQYCPRVISSFTLLNTIFLNDNGLQYCPSIISNFTLLNMIYPNDNGLQYCPIISSFTWLNMIFLKDNGLQYCLKIIFVVFLRAKAFYRLESILMLIEIVTYPNQARRFNVTELRNVFDSSGHFPVHHNLIIRSTLRRRVFLSLEITIVYSSDAVTIASKL